VKKLLVAEIEEVTNGVLLTIGVPNNPSSIDPLGQRSGWSMGPTYYADLPQALAAIHSETAVREAKKALGA
jgi:hypothetical protein